MGVASREGDGVGGNGLVHVVDSAVSHCGGHVVGGGALAVKDGVTGGDLRVEVGGNDDLSSDGQAGKVEVARDARLESRGHGETEGAVDIVVVAEGHSLHLGHTAENVRVLGDASGPLDLQ